MRIRVLIGLAALAGLAAPAAAATSSADLDTLAKTLEANTAANTTLNSKLLSLIREPAKTLEGRTLPTSAANYTNTIDTALKLAPDPAHWYVEVRALPSAVYGVACAATISYWEPTPPPGLRMESNAFGKGNCPSVLSAAVAKAWAWKLRQIGR